MKQLRAQFSGNCGSCKGLIAVGASIRRGTGGWVHTNCDAAKDEQLEQPAVLASPEKRASAKRGWELAMKVMERAAAERASEQAPSWYDQLPKNVRNVECPDCCGQDLDFERSNDGFPHWQVACCRCGSVSSFPNRPLLRSSRAGNGFHY